MPHQAPRLSAQVHATGTGESSIGSDDDDNEARMTWIVIGVIGVRLALWRLRGLKGGCGDDLIVVVEVYAEFRHTHSSGWTLLFRCRVLLVLGK